MVDYEKAQGLFSPSPTSRSTRNEQIAVTTTAPRFNARACAVASTIIDDNGSHLELPIALPDSDILSFALDNQVTAGIHKCHRPGCLNLTLATRKTLAAADVHDETRRSGTYSP
jgi:hypothetical protein